MVVEKHDFIEMINLHLISQEVYNDEAILIGCGKKMLLLNITFGVVDLSECSGWKRSTTYTRRKLSYM